MQDLKFQTLVVTKNKPTDFKYYTFNNSNNNNINNPIDIPVISSPSSILSVWRLAPNNKRSVWSHWNDNYYTLDYHNTSSKCYYYYYYDSNGSRASKNQQNCLLYVIGQRAVSYGKGCPPIWPASLSIQEKTPKSRRSDTRRWHQHSNISSYDWYFLLYAVWTN